MNFIIGGGGGGQITKGAVVVIKCQGPPPCNLFFLRRYPLLAVRDETLARFIRKDERVGSFRTSS